jgi:hypothetical protein
VVGGESSKSKDVARLMTLEDARYVLTEAAAAGAKVLLKQLGTRWAIASGTYGRTIDGKISEEVRKGGHRDFWPNELQSDIFHQHPDAHWARSH